MEAEQATRSRAARVWAQRAEEELVAAERFERLADELDRFGAAPEVVALARQAGPDERRHHKLCLALAKRLGVHDATLRGPRARTTPVPLSPRGLTGRERTLYEVVAMSCVTETLSAALLGVMAERATDEAVRETVRSVLRDEVQHSRVGWAHLAHESPAGCADTVRDLLPAVLSGTVGDALFVEGGDDAEAPALSGYGVLSRAESAAIFAETMRGVVFPGLERFGVDAAKARQWLDARVGPAG